MAPLLLLFSASGPECASAASPAAVPSSFDPASVQDEITKGHLSDARAALEDRIRRVPRDGFAHLLMGIVLGQSGEAVAAEAQFVEAGRLRPRDPAPHTNLGNLLATRGEFSAAKKQFETAIALNPGDSVSLSNLGSVEMSLKQYSAALTHFEAADRAAPRDVRTLLGLFQAQLRLGLTAPSEATAERLIHSPGVDEQAIQIVGALQGESGQNARAARTFEEGCVLFPNSSSLQFNRGLALQRAGDAKRAIAVFEGLRSRLDTAELENVLGSVYEQDGQFLAAIRSYQEAAEMEPASEDYRFDYASELLAHRNFEPARLVTERAVNDFPNSVRMSVALGVALFGLEHVQEAQGLLVQTAHRFPDDVLPLLYISLCAEATATEIPGAEQLLQGFYRRHPRDPIAPYLLGRNVLLSGDAAAAAKFQQASIHLRSDYAPSHFELGRAYAELGRTEEAVDQYRAALHLDPKNTETWYRLTVAYRKLGRTELADDAEREFRKLEETSGKSDVVQSFRYNVRK